MRFDNVAILGLEYVDAPHRVSSSDIMEQLAETFERLGVRQDLLVGVAGIEARRWWDAGTSPSDAATLAARKVIASTGVDPSRIGILINTSVCRDYLEPSTACLVHGNLGLSPECLNFDIGNACLAFLNGMDTAGAMLERGAIDYALVVDGETARPVTESTIARLNRPETTAEEARDHFAALTLGSGAVAMLLGRADEQAGHSHRFMGGVTLAATQHSGLCKGQMDWMTTDTRRLLAAGVEIASMTWVRAQKELGWTPEVLDELVLHQVSRVHTASLLSMLRLDIEKAYMTFPEYGNLGPASVPLVLAKAAEQGRVHPGSRVGLLGIGSGLNCTMAEVVW
ncbi:MAG: 3-oxoacyl-ACP synthase III [Myxococcota bacterium]|nr:3-oxoacyl-ACP synthase III [Myxococcota bacterium]